MMAGSANYGRSKKVGRHQWEVCAVGVLAERDAGKGVVRRECVGLGSHWACRCSAAAGYHAHASLLHCALNASDVMGWTSSLY